MSIQVPAGTKSKSDEVRQRVLGTKPLPKIREVFSKVQREESRKKVMMGSPQSKTDSVVTPIENSTMAACGVQSQTNAGKERPRCDHCQRPGQYKDTCRKLHGKQADWKPRFEREGRSNLATGTKTTTNESSMFSKEQLDLLQRMFSHTSQNPNPSVTRVGYLAQKGTFLNALNVRKETGNLWIVDSRPSGDATIFHSYKPCHDTDSVRIADGSLSKVTGVGSIIISSSLTLNCNLLSIS